MTPDFRSYKRYGSNSHSYRTINHIRSQEWIDGKDNEEGWYNSYYDNHGEKIVIDS